MSTYQICEWDSTTNQQVTRDATSDEIAGILADIAAIPLVPQKITIVQAKTALLNMGLLDAVNTAITALTGMEGQTAQIYWEYTSTLERQSSTLASVMAQINILTSDQLDALFTAAAQL